MIKMGATGITHKWLELGPYVYLMWLRNNVKNSSNLIFNLLNQINKLFTHLKLWLATTTHNLKWIKIIPILDHTFTNIDF